MGNGGGIYVPIVMRNLDFECSPEKETHWVKQSGGAEPGWSEELGAGNGAHFWDCAAEYFTV